MRLFWQEMKKIWQPGILAAIALLGAMFYYVLPWFCVEQISEERYIVPFDIIEELYQRCGPSVDRFELPVLQEIIDREKELFAGFLAENPAAAAAGVATWDELESYTERERNESRSEDGVPQTPQLALWAQRSGNTNWFCIRRLEELKAECETEHLWSDTISIYFQYYPPQWQQRILELKEREAEEGVSLLYTFDHRYTSLYFDSYLPMSNVLCIILLLSPALVRDRLRRVRSMQWSSRRGRGTLRVQMAAGFASAGLLIAVNTAVYSAAMLSTGVAVFWNCPYAGLNWFHWTFGQYVLCSIGLAALIGLAAAGLTLFLSQHSGNYVSMLFKAIVLYLAVGWWFVSEMQQISLFGSLRPFGSWTFFPPAFVPACAGALLALSLGLCAWTCVRQKKRELV